MPTSRQKWIKVSHALLLYSQALAMDASIVESILVKIGTPSELRAALTNIILGPLKARLLGLMKPLDSYESGTLSPEIFPLVADGSITKDADTALASIWALYDLRLSPVVSAKNRSGIWELCCGCGDISSCRCGSRLRCCGG